MHISLLAAVAAIALPLPALAQMDPATLRDAALKDDVAWDITEGITTEIGPRLAGSDAEARARAWAVKKLTALGFSNVKAEPFPLKTWVRGEEKMEVLSPFPQPLHLTALGNSGATSAKGLEAEIVYFPDLAALEAAPDGSLKGKIAFVSHAMTRTQDGSQYGPYGGVRRRGPATAAKKGAAAIVIRSIGTDYHRNPHAGGTSFPEGTAAIPAAALSLPDSEQLERILKRGQPVRVKLTLTPKQVGIRESGNVVADVPGSDPSAGVVVVACHLDSWDLGTGAFDDAAGCGIVAAAAKRIMDAGQPRRTIRVLWAGSEEVGGPSGEAYLKAHGLDRHVFAGESDFGADRVWQVQLKLPGGAKGVGERVATTLAPLGISRTQDGPVGGADIAMLARKGVSGVNLNQDGTRYFDLHHTPDDTLDKIDPSQLRQNVAAWTAVLAVVANAPEEIGAAQ